MANQVLPTQQENLLCSSAPACQHGSLCSSVFCESSMAVHTDQDFTGTGYCVWQGQWRGGSDNNRPLLSLLLALVWQWVSLTTVWSYSLFLSQPSTFIMHPCCNIQKCLFEGSPVASSQDQAVPVMSSLWLVIQLVSHGPVVRPSLPIRINHPNQKEAYYCCRASPDLHAAKRERERRRGREQNYCPAVPNESPLSAFLEKAQRSWWGDPWEPQALWSLVGLCSGLDTEAVRLMDDEK